MLRTIAHQAGGSRDHALKALGEAVDLARTDVLSHSTQTFPEDGWDAFCLSADGAPVVGAKSLVLGAHHSFYDAQPLDILIHPGGPGTRPMLRDPDHLRWVRDLR